MGAALRSRDFLEGVQAPLAAYAAHPRAGKAAGCEAARKGIIYTRGKASMLSFSLKQGFYKKDRKTIP